MTGCSKHDRPVFGCEACDYFRAWNRSEKQKGRMREALERCRGILKELQVAWTPEEAALAWKSLRETLEEAVCADLPELKKGRWVEFQIYVETGRYSFRTADGTEWRLHEAPGMVGFGGVKYGELWFATPMWLGGQRSPENPVAVRFWVEE